MQSKKVKNSHGKGLSFLHMEQSMDCGQKQTNKNLNPSVKAKARLIKPHDNDPRNEFRYSCCFLKMNQMALKSL